MTTTRFTLPPVVARAYIERISWFTKPGNPWFYEACAVHHELLDPCTDINEFLAWIDHHPASQFERHLKCLVHGAPRS